MQSSMGEVGREEEKADKLAARRTGGGAREGVAEGDQ